MTEPLAQSLQPRCLNELDLLPQNFKKEADAARQRIWRKNHPHRHRETVWRGQGIKFTYEQYHQLYTEQEGKCGICHTYCSRLDVDHNHTTGQVRGLLCGNCNRGIGLFKDSTDLLKKASKYVSRTAD